MMKNQNQKLNCQADNARTDFFRHMRDANGKLTFNRNDIPVGGLFVESDGLETTLEDDGRVDFYVYRSDASESLGAELADAILESGIGDAFCIDAWIEYLQSHYMLETAEDAEGGVYYVVNSDWKKLVIAMLQECFATTEPTEPTEPTESTDRDAYNALKALHAYAEENKLAVNYNFYDGKDYQEGICGNFQTSVSCYLGKYAFSTVVETEKNRRSWTVYAYCGNNIHVVFYLTR